jgi:predicted N-acetyltransferase YhbS
MTINYIIEKADLANPAIDLEVRQVIQAAFKEQEIRPENYIYNNIDSKASRPSLMLVAKENGAIIGCNAFIANDFTLGGRSYVGYQSCWTATHPDHQGKKVFVNIINEAKRLLKEEGAGFLYGLPNDNSYPIFTKKLGFGEFDTMYARVWNIPLLKNANLETMVAPIPANTLVIDEEQLYAHKKRQKDEMILRADFENSFIWGKIEKRKKYGIAFIVFVVGGIHFANPQHVRPLFASLFRKYKVGFAELISCKLNTTNACVKNWKKAPSMNGFIYFNLNMPDNIGMNYMIGAIDVF